MKIKDKFPLERGTVLCHLCCLEVFCEEVKTIYLSPEALLIRLVQVFRLPGWSFLLLSTFFSLPRVEAFTPQLQWLGNLRFVSIKKWTLTQLRLREQLGIFTRFP